jgi:hypothetical protein
MPGPLIVSKQSAIHRNVLPSEMVPVTLTIGNNSGSTLMNVKFQ